MSRKSRLVVLLALVVLAAMTLGGASVVQGSIKKFNNVKLTVFGDAGHNLKPFEWYKGDLKDQFGIVIDEVVGVFDYIIKFVSLFFVGIIKKIFLCWINKGSSMV